MTSFNDQFLLASLRNDDYQQQQLGGHELLQAQAAELELGSNPNALALRSPFDPTAHDLVIAFDILITNAIFFLISIKNSSKNNTFSRLQIVTWYSDRNEKLQNVIRYVFLNMNANETLSHFK